MDNHNHTDLSSEVMNHLREQKLLEARTIFLSEGVGSGTAKRMISDLLTLDQQSSDPIFLFINSPGGEVNSGFAIFDTIRFIKSPVHIINAGLCASIATILNVATPKHLRFSLPNTKFLIHQPLISGMVRGPAADIEITAIQILKTREKINQILAEECGQELARVAEDTQRDYWMTAEEALEYGLITKIITTKSEIM